MTLCTASDSVKPGVSYSLLQRELVRETEHMVAQEHTNAERSGDH